MMRVHLSLVMLASGIVVHRDDSYKIKAVSLKISRGSPRISKVMWGFFTKEAQDYILNKYPLVLSSLEIELF
jgi:hypothetical protein